MIVNQAKFELMERAILHLGGEIKNYTRQKYTLRIAILNDIIVWQARKERAVPYMYKITKYRELGEETAG